MTATEQRHPHRHPLNRRAAIAASVGVVLGAALVVATVGVSTLPALPPLTEATDPQLTGHIAYQTWRDEVCVYVVDASTGAQRELKCAEDGLEYRWSEAGTVEVGSFVEGYDEPGPEGEPSFAVTAYDPVDGSVAGTYEATDWFPYGGEDPYREERENGSDLAGYDDWHLTRSPDDRWAYGLDMGQRVVLVDPEEADRAWLVASEGDMVSWHMPGVGTTYLR